MKKYKYQVVLLALLAITAAVLLLTRKSGTLRSHENDFAVADTSAVTKIYLADRQNNSVKLVRLADGAWQLNEKYEADPVMMQIIMKTINTVDVMEPVAKAARNNIIRVMSGKSVKVEIYQQVYRINIFDKIKLFSHEKRTRTYFVGDATMDSQGTYMLMDGSEEPYVVGIPGFKGYVAARYSPLEADWRGHTIFKFRVPDIKSISVSYSDTPANSFIINHVSEKQFALAALSDNRNIPQFDTLKVVEYMGMYRNKNFESVLDNLPKAKFDSITRLSPTIEITLVDRLGKPHTLKTWKRKAETGQLDVNGNQMDWDLDRMYGQVEGVKELVTVQYFALGELFMPLSWFLKEQQAGK